MYDNLNPEDYRQALVEMGATAEDADAAVEDLRRQQDRSA